MSSNKPPGSGANKPPDSSSGANKKGKSKGFIESSGFKPGWLETGPLPPLPPPPTSATPEDSQSVAEELAALQEALQRYYGTPTADDEPLPVAPDDIETMVAEAPTAAEPLVHESEALSVEPEDSAPAASPVAASADEVSAAEPPAALDPALAPPAWILAIAPPAESAPGVAAPPAPETAATAPPAFAIETPLADTEPQPDSPLTPAEEAPPEIASYFAEPPSDGDTITLLAAADALQPAADTPNTAEAPVAPTAKRQRRPRREQSERRAERPIRRRSRLSTALLAISLLLLAAAATVYFVNPFTRLALGLASLARPVASPGVTPPGAAEDNWCLQGNFPTGDALPRLQDGGAQGDLVANDQVFSLEYAIPRPGNYRWQVVDCNDPTRAFPAATAWLTTVESNQPVTFIFDSNERADRLFFPIPYVVSAVDGVEEYHVIGSFQDWIADDASGRLEPLSSGLYQQVRRIARSGSYEAYVIAGNEEQAIDAYGRTTEPIPFAFDTEQNGEYVVFLIDVDRGRASVMYDMPPLVTRLAFGGGHRLLSLALAGLAGLLLLFLLLREMALRNERLWMETGCPRCREQELMRISRRTSDRLLHLLGIPAYRYRCRNCTWEGTRLSEAGRSISPGASIARIEGLR
jgi:hypothetical protein